MKSFDDLIKERLSQPVRDKAGNLLTSKETGEVITPMEAMVMSVVNEAMKGSIQHIAFIRNIQRNDNTDNEAAKQMHEDRRYSLIQQLRDELNTDGLSAFVQEYELEMIAEQRMLVDTLNEQISCPDFQPLISEYTAGGQMKMVLNPIVSLRDAQQKKLQQDIKEMRMEAKIKSRRKS